MNLSPECSNLMKSMLSKSAFERPTVEECLQHDWFKKDRESLRNLIEFNKYICSPNSMTKASIKNEYISFFMSPNYFQNLEVSSKMQTSQYLSININFRDFRERSRSQNKPFKVCYNQALSRSKLLDCSQVSSLNNQALPNNNNLVYKKQSD